MFKDEPQSRMQIAADAHEEGRKAYRAKVPYTDNPYNQRAKAGSISRLKFSNWEKGWTWANFTSKSKSQNNKSKKGTFAKKRVAKKSCKKRRR